MKISKTLMLLFFSFLFSSKLYGQNQVDDNGRKHGVWKKKYPNGQIQYKGQFKHGKPVDTFKRYYPNGKIKAIMIYKDQGKVYAQLYDKKEIKKAEGYFINRKKDSVWNYYNEYGNLVSKDRYENGQKHGKSVKFYRSGDTSQVSHWKKGTKDGLFKQYFTNGKLKLLSNYKNGKINGYVTVFFPDGSKKIEGKYVNNLKEGKWVYFEDNRDTSKVINYKDGTPLNSNELEEKEYKEILELENNKGKFESPRDEFYKNPRRRK